MNHGPKRGTAAEGDKQSQDRDPAGASHSRRKGRAPQAADTPGDSIVCRQDFLCEFSFPGTL